MSRSWFLMRSFQSALHQAQRDTIYTQPKDMSSSQAIEQWFQLESLCSSHPEPMVALHLALDWP